MWKWFLAEDLQQRRPAEMSPQWKGVKSNSFTCVFSCISVPPPKSARSHYGVGCLILFFNVIFFLFFWEIVTQETKSFISVMFFLLQSYSRSGLTQTPKCANSHFPRRNRCTTFYEDKLAPKSFTCSFVVSPKKAAEVWRTASSLQGCTGLVGQSEWATDVYVDHPLQQMDRVHTSLDDESETCVCKATSHVVIYRKAFFLFVYRSSSKVLILVF